MFCNYTAKWGWEEVCDALCHVEGGWGGGGWGEGRTYRADKNGTIAFANNVSVDSWVSVDHDARSVKWWSRVLTNVPRRRFTSESLRQRSVTAK